MKIMNIYIAQSFIWYQNTILLFKVMIFKSINNIFKILTTHSKYFSSRDWHINHIADATVKAQRKQQIFDMNLIKKTKQVVYAQKRSLDSTIFGLRKQGKCAGVILSRQKFPQLDIVLDGGHMRKLTKRTKFMLEPIYVRYQGEQIKCLFQQMQTYSKQFIIKAVLKRFIAGEPNHFTLPITINNFTNNELIQGGGKVDIYHHSVDVICYNEDWPACLSVDISYANLQRQYRMGDLINLLPPGIYLHPKVNLSEPLLKLYKGQKLDLSDLDQAIQAQKQSNQKKGKPGAPAAGGAPGGAATGTAASSAGGGAAKKQPQATSPKKK